MVWGSIFSTGFPEAVWYIAIDKEVSVESSLTRLGEGKRRS